MRKIITILAFFFYACYAGPVYQKILDSVRIFSLKDCGRYLWVGTLNSIIKYDKSNNSYQAYDSILHKKVEYISDIAVDRAGRVWFASEGTGIYMNEGATWTVFDSVMFHYGRYTFKSPPGKISSLAFDTSGTMWFGGGSPCCGKYRNGTWYLGLGSVVDTNFISSLTVSNKNDLWVGTRGNGAFQLLNCDTGRLIHHTTASCFRTDAASRTNDDIFDIYSNHDTIWVNYFYGYSKYYGNSWHLTDSFDNLNGQVTTDLRNRLLLCSKGHGLILCDGVNRSSIMDFDFGIATAFVNAVAVDSGNNYWIGSAQGLFYYGERRASAIETRLHPLLNGLSLGSCLPNPFAGKTKIDYNTGKNQGGYLKIFSPDGRQILAQKVAGTGKVTWDAKGRPAGVYLCRLSAGGKAAIRRLVVAR